MTVQLIGAYALKSRDPYDYAPKGLRSSDFAQVSLMERDTQTLKLTNSIVVVIKPAKLAAMLLEQQGDHDLAIAILLRELNDLALKGRTEIENGDVYRPELSDNEFSEIVPRHMEDDMIAAMATSGAWTRGISGWWLAK